MAETEWTITSPAEVYRLWDEDVITVHCKPHFAALSESLQISANQVISTVVDGLTIAAHHGKPKQVARFGDRITLDADGTYTVHVAASSALEG